MSIGKVHSQGYYRITVVPFTYKKGLIKTLIDRTFRLNNTWDGLHLDLEKLKVILQKHEYRPTLIDKLVNRYLNKKIMKNLVKQNQVRLKKTSDTSNCLL